MFQLSIRESIGVATDGTHVSLSLLYILKSFITLILYLHAVVSLSRTYMMFRYILSVNDI